MDVESTPPQNAAHPLTNSTLPTTDVPPSPPDTISDMRKTMMVGDTRAQADTPSMDVDSDQAAAGYSAAGQPTVSTPPPSQISLRLRHPGLHPDTGGGESSGPSRASTPGTGSAAKRRKGYVPPLPTLHGSAMWHIIVTLPALNLVLHRAFGISPHEWLTDTVGLTCWRLVHCHLRGPTRPRYRVEAVKALPAPHLQDPTPPARCPYSHRPHRRRYRRLFKAS